MTALEITGAYRVGHEPIHFAGVLDIAGNLLEPVLSAVGRFHQIGEPRADHRAVPPAAQDLGHVETLAVLLDQIQALRESGRRCRRDARMEIGNVGNPGAWCNTA